MDFKKKGGLAPDEKSYFASLQSKKDNGNLIITKI